MSSPIIMQLVIDGRQRLCCTVCSRPPAGPVEVDCLDSNPESSVRCCEACLKAGQDQIDRRLRKQIWEHEHDAAYLRGLLGRVKVPAYAEWQAAVKARAEFWAEAEREHRAESDAALIAALKDGSGPWYPDGYPEDLKLTPEDVMRGR
jgi:hypothetical protein